MPFIVPNQIAEQLIPLSIEFVKAFVTPHQYFVTAQSFMPLEYHTSCIALGSKAQWSCVELLVLVMVTLQDHLQ